LENGDGQKFASYSWVNITSLYISLLSFLLAFATISVQLH